MNIGNAAEHFRKGIEAAQLGFPDKAAAEFEEAAYLEPDNAEVQFQPGNGVPLDGGVRAGHRESFESRRTETRYVGRMGQPGRSPRGNWRR